MNWKVILQLSMFGLLMGIATVFLVPSKFELLFWVPIFLICGYVIAKRRENRHFVHGLLLGLANCVWITGAHILFAERYLSTHAAEAKMMLSMPRPDSPRLMMAMMGPLVGLVSGLIIGLLAFLASKLVRPKAAAAAK
jgi:hypothetical protein